MLLLSLAAAPAVVRAAFATPPIARQVPTEDPDRLYADRVHLDSARRAVAIWEERLRRNPADFEAAWKVARGSYWLGGHVPPGERRSQYERGVEAGRRAVAIDPHRPEGHFWMAANMGALAESFGLRQGLKYRRAIKDALETVRRIDPAFQQGSADRALGRWYFKVPAFAGGSKQRALEHLERSLAYNPNSTASRYFLAEVLLALDRRTDAATELERVLDAPLDPEWTPEDLEFKDKARKLLATLASGRTRR